MYATKNSKSSLITLVNDVSLSVMHAKNVANLVHTLVYVPPIEKLYASYAYFAHMDRISLAIPLFNIFNGKIFPKYIDNSTCDWEWYFFLCYFDEIFLFLF